MYIHTCLLETGGGQRWAHRLWRRRAASCRPEEDMNVLDRSKSVPGHPKPMDKTQLYTHVYINLHILICIYIYMYLFVFDMSLYTDVSVYIYMQLIFILWVYAIYYVLRRQVSRCFDIPQEHGNSDLQGRKIMAFVLKRMTKDSGCCLLWDPNSPKVGENLRAIGESRHELYLWSPGLRMALV